MKISAIIPTHNRAVLLNQALKSIILEPFHEVIVIDNNSTDCTKYICMGYYRTVKYVFEPKQGLNFARNRGIKEASGEVLCFFDDDIIINPGYCEAVKNGFKGETFGGKIIPIYETKKPKWMNKYLVGLVSGLDLGNKKRKFKKYPIGANMGFKKEIFDKHLFNPNLDRSGLSLIGGGEKDLFMRLKKNAEYLPDALVYHYITNDRLTIKHIKKLSISIGATYRKMYSLDKLLFMELFKWIASIGLAVILRNKMMIVFRYWILKGIIKKNSL